MYTSPSEMEPLLPTHDRLQLDELAGELLRRAASLGSLLVRPSREELVHLLRQMNSYYSNLIEGHNTHPVDIERALNRDFAADPATRALQLESRAHVEVQALIEARLTAQPDTAICSEEFLCWVHREFYERVPESFRMVRDADGDAHAFAPGELRTRDVEVGRHLPPAHQALAAFMRRFEETYDAPRLGPLDRIIAAAASHQRLAWIHPFVDGNGRVTRLFTDAWLARARVDAHGLWTMSRGFARHRTRYMQALAAVDQPRMGDLDGGGNLSDKALSSFCRFFLETALDQVDYMTGLLELDGLQQRIRGYVERRAAMRELRPEAAWVLCDLVVKGEVPRGEIARIAGMAERSARLLIGALQQQGLVRSDSPKGPLRIAFPIHAVGYYFPRLFPEGAETAMFESAPEPPASVPRRPSR